MECVISASVCKDASETQPWGFNLALRFARKWKPHTPFEAGARVRPAKLSTQTGSEYESSGGVSGTTEPRWPNPARETRTTVKDGSITWTLRAISDDSLLERIDTVEWDDGGLDFDEAPVIDTAAYQGIGGQFSGGDEGETYRPYALITTTLGNKYKAELVVEIHQQADA